MSRRGINHSGTGDNTENDSGSEDGSENDSGSKDFGHKYFDIIYPIVVLSFVLLLCGLVFGPPYWERIARENAIIARENAIESAVQKNKLCTTDLCQRWRNSLVDKTKNDIEEALREAQCKISFKIDALVDCESSLEYILKEVPDANGLHCSNDEFNTFYYLNWCKGD